MRKNPTPAEARLRKQLVHKRQGIKIRFQEVILGWIADFYCAKAKLVIEVDGSVHDTPEQRASDAIRDSVMESKGLKVVRFSNDRVLHDTKAVVREIVALATGRISPPKQFACSRDQNRPDAGFSGKRSLAEHAVSVANPRRSMKLRATEAIASQG